MKQIKTKLNIKVQISDIYIACQFGIFKLRGISFHDKQHLFKSCFENKKI